MNIGGIYGRLGRVGVATPFGGQVATTDFHRYLHPDIQVAEVQVPMANISPEGLKKMSEDVEGYMRMFPQYMAIDLAFLSCTSGSLIGGAGYDSYLCKVIKDASQAREAYTTTTTVLMAMRALASKNVSVITPYPDNVNEIEKMYFEKEGFSITNIDTMAYSLTDDPYNHKYIPRIEPELIYDFAIKHINPKADTLLLSCTGLTVFTIIDALEKRLSVPVVTSNQSAAWAIGKFIGYHGTEAYKLGTLFTK